jgi:hypothetical protein
MQYHRATDLWWDYFPLELLYKHASCISELIGDPGDAGLLAFESKLPLITKPLFLYKPSFYSFINYE